MASTEFETLLAKPYRHIGCKMFSRFDDVIATSEDWLISANVIFSAGVDGYTIGDCITKECRLRMYNPEDHEIPGITWGGFNIRSTPFRLVCGLYSDDGTLLTDKDEGFFFVSKISSEDDYQTLDIVAYDASAHWDIKYQPRIHMPCTAQSILDDIAQYLNISSIPYVINADKYDVLPQSIKYTFNSLPSGTFRDYLGWLAGLIGCNAILSGDGNSIIFRSPQGYDADYTISRDVQYMGGLRVGIDKNRWNTVNRVEVDTNTTVLSYTWDEPVTNGITVSMSNPLVTADILERVANYIVGLSYVPFECEWRGRPGVGWGDVVDIEIEDGSIAHSVIMENETTIDGGLKCDSKAIDLIGAETSTESVNRRNEREAYEAIAKRLEDASIPDVKVTDVAVAQGYDADTGFHYQKFSSGICELWGMETIDSVPITTAGVGGVIHYSANIDRTLPFKVTGAFATVTCDGQCWSAVASCGTYLRFRILSGASRTVNVGCRYYIKALWKDLTEYGSMDSGGTAVQYDDGDEVSY